MLVYHVVYRLVYVRLYLYVLPFVCTNPHPAIAIQPHTPLRVRVPVELGGLSDQK